MSKSHYITMPEPHVGPPYPGLGLPLRIDSKDAYSYPIGIQGSGSNTISECLPVRELAMMHIMDRLTDKPGWQKKIWDDEIVDKWRMEAKSIPDFEFWDIATQSKMTMERERYEAEEAAERAAERGEADPPYQPHKCPLDGIVNDNTFDCIVQELRSKAKYFEKTGIVVTMDASASISKSDHVVPSQVHDQLRDTFDRLIADQSHSPDWHPNSNDMVLDLVHPSMYPLVNGQSKVFKEELVGIANAVSTWSGKGTVLPKNETTASGEGHRYAVSRDNSSYWNETYQWLPANVLFQNNGSVKFTSCINNLHPQRYAEIYHTIENLVEVVLPLWDQCLNEAGRLESRFDNPDNPDDNIAENWIPSDPKELSHAEVNWDEVWARSSWFQYDDDEDEEVEKWKFFRKARIPEAEFKDVDYTPTDPLLSDEFRETGLQIIVKMTSIELTPEKPDFPGGGWHIEGQMNERICATALYYLDCENVTTSSLSFRMPTSAYLQEEFDVGQDSYSWLEKIFGTELHSSAPCLQNYGSVETSQGRLLAFPNVFQHRVSPFSLIDKTRPGHRRFIALWLVDPYQRIISTANVPPQQQDWWFDSIVGDTQKPAPEAVPATDDASSSSTVKPEKKRKLPFELPLELMDMVWENFASSEDKGLMSEEEAKEHRIKLMEMRTTFVDKSDKTWHAQTYSFCEH